MKYRKKPIEIEATQWFKMDDHPSVSTLENPTEGRDLQGLRDKICEKCGHAFMSHGSVPTLEGRHIVCVGDWIITGIAGEEYPCKPDIFEQTYDLVT